MSLETILINIKQNSHFAIVLSIWIWTYKVCTWSSCYIFFFKKWQNTYKCWSDPDPDVVFLKFLKKITKTRSSAKFLSPRFKWTGLNVFHCHVFELILRGKLFFFFHFSHFYCYSYLSFFKAINHTQFICLINLINKNDESWKYKVHCIISTFKSDIIWWVYNL